MEQQQGLQPAAKHRKKSKNKFKPDDAAEQHPPAAPAPQPHAVLGGAEKKRKKKRKAEVAAGEVAEAVIVRADAPKGVQQQGQRQAIPVPAPAAAAAGSGAKKKRKQKRKAELAAGEVDETVAVQADAPKAVKQPAQRQPPPPAASAAGIGGSKAALGGRPTPLASLGSGKKGKGGGSLLEQMRARLQGGRFRWLNEALYTSDGAAALALVQREPEVMDQYHAGFREQTKGWPVQPVDQAIAWLRSHPPAWVVADLGCGDARIAASLSPAPRQQRVHSFDLSVTAPGVVPCNMAAVPLPAGAADAAIFCLSLMGTDYGSFLEEAARILKPDGWLWIAEVQSRFVGADGRSVLPAFEAALGTLGFQVRRKDTSNSHFLVVEAQRTAQQRGSGGGKGKGRDKQQQQQGRGKQQQQQQGGGGGGTRPDWPELRACQYKKR